MRSKSLVKVAMVLKSLIFLMPDSKSIVVVNP